MVLTSKLQDKEGTVVILEEHILQLKREHETQMADFMQDKNEEEEVRWTYCFGGMFYFH